MTFLFLDRCMLACYTARAHKFQRFTGRMSYALARYCYYAIEVVCVIVVVNSWTPILGKTELVLPTAMALLIGVVLVPMSLLILQSIERRFLENPEVLPNSNRNTFVQLFRVVLALLDYIRIPGRIESVLTASTIKPLGVIVALYGLFFFSAWYFEDVVPLPP